MRLSDEILDRNAEAYRKIRNTFRYLLGNIAGFDPDRDGIPVGELEEIDRWALHQLDEVRGRMIEGYLAHQYHVAYHAMNQFCTVTLSSIYRDILKDRLYTSPRRPRERRSAQTALHRIAVDLCRLMAPILCFTAEEVWQELEALEGRPRWGSATVHAATFPDPLDVPEDRPLLERWSKVLAVREEVLRALETERAAKRIGTGLEATVRIETSPEMEAFLRTFGEGLRFVFITSGVTFGSGGDPLRVVVSQAEGTKCERCWNRTTDVGARIPGACGRCAEGVLRILAEAGS